MPILENEYYSGNNRFRYSGWSDYAGDAQSYIRFIRREGTGRRRKPATPDKTAYSRRQYEVQLPRGFGIYTAPSGAFLRWDGANPNPGNYVQGSQSSLGQFNPNILDVAALRAMKAFDRRDMDLGTAWLERQKTASLVRDVATIGVNALNAIRKRNGRELLDALGLTNHGSRGDGVVDTYLAYHYGMKPLLYDVAGSVQALTRLPTGTWRVDAKGSYSDSNDKDTLIGENGYEGFMCSSQYRESAQALVSAVMRPLSREDDLRWSLGLDAPLSTAWEVTPFSFVVDWIVPIGDWLQALNSFKYYDGWQGCYTQYLTEELQFSGAKYSVSGGSYSSTCTGHAKYLTINRSITNGLPLLGLPIKDPRSIDHMAKALSLLASKSARKGDLPPSVRY